MLWGVSHSQFVARGHKEASFDHEPQKKVLKHFMCELDLI
jgi:hypothetical protein